MDSTALDDGVPDHDGGELETVTLAKSIQPLNVAKRGKYIINAYISPSVGTIIFNTIY